MCVVYCKLMPNGHCSITLSVFRISELCIMVTIIVCHNNLLPNLGNCISFVLLVEFVEIYVAL